MTNKPKPAALARAHAAGLTLTQQSAVDLLVVGKNDPETAELLGVNRVTVTRWRLYDVQFRAALARRRAEVWGAAGDRLRALLPRALDALAEALGDENHRVPVALALLKLAGPLPALPAEPTDPEEYVRQEVERERERLRQIAGQKALDNIRGLPNHGAHLESVRVRLDALAGEETGTDGEECATAK